MLLTKRRRVQLLTVSVLLVPLLGWIDTSTGYELSFGIFYLPPIALATWAGGALPGLMVSILSAVTWGVADTLSGHHYSSGLYIIWNSIIRLVSFIVVCLLLADRQRAHAREFALARTDALTGLANARHFQEVIEAELTRARRYRRALSLAYVDLDNFKVVNDRSGHAAGDSVLKIMAAALRRELRDVDTAARLGGDEFAILLPEAGPEAAEGTARRVHRALRAAALQTGYPISASIGVVTCRTAPPSRHALLHHADKLMYSVKRTSKNAVACSIFDQREAAVG
jgi:diguanylate cyclase (GGDEF)-like protein